MRAIDVILLKRDVAHQARVNRKLFTASLMSEPHGAAGQDDLIPVIEDLALNLTACEPLWIAEELLPEIDGRTTYSDPIRFGSESPWVSHGMVFFERPIVGLGMFERPDAFDTETYGTAALPVSAVSWAQGLIPVLHGATRIPGVVAITWASRASMIKWAASRPDEPDFGEMGFDMIPTGFAAVGFDGWFIPERRPTPEGDVKMDYYDGDVVERAATATLPVFLHHLWKMLREDIVVHGQERGTRKHQKAMRRAKMKETWVTTVHLRHRVYDSEAEGDGRAIDWSHRWYVRGHKRRITDRRTGEVRETWVHGYIKGPPDKPLMMREHLYVLDT